MLRENKYLFLYIALALLPELTLTENSMKLKDVLKNSSKFNNNNRNSDTYKNNESDDIFRNEVTNNLGQCTSDNSDMNKDESNHNNKDNYNNNDSGKKGNYGNSGTDSDTNNYRNNYNAYDSKRQANSYNMERIDNRNCPAYGENDRFSNGYSNSYGNKKEYSDRQDNNERSGYGYNDNYGNSGYNRRSNTNDYGHRIRRSNTKNEYENQCTSQCVFGYMEMLDDDQLPSETLFVKWVQDNIKNDDLKRIQILREIRKCFARLSTSDIEDGCELSKELAKCLNLELE